MAKKSKLRFSLFQLLLVTVGVALLTAIAVRIYENQSNYHSFTFAAPDSTDSVIVQIGERRGQVEFLAITPQDGRTALVGETSTGRAIFDEDGTKLHSLPSKKANLFERTDNKLIEKKFDLRFQEVFEFVVSQPNEITLDALTSFVKKSRQ